MIIFSSLNTLLNYPIFGRGFRPFFLLGALYSIFNLLMWGGFYAGFIVPPSVFSDPVLWHAHEMIYGFSIAIISGFLLTAIANWTGTAPTKHLPLAGLCLLWISGRIVMNFEMGLPSIIIFTIEGAFIPALIIILSIPLLKNWNKRNFIFLALLSFLSICNIICLVTEDRYALYSAILIIIAIISLIGGRVIPAFTVSALRQKGHNVTQTPQMKLDVLALLSLLSLIIILIVIGTDGIILAIMAFISSFIHALRMRRYHTRKTLNDPIVWILHAGYAWVIVGLFLIGISALSSLPFSIALHALTVGAIGSMTLGMMCRVTLGHTGRNLIATKLTILSFVLMQCLALIRVGGAILYPESMSLWISLSAFLWSICFGLYIFVYAPILWQPRADGRPA